MLVCWSVTCGRVESSRGVPEDGAQKGDWDLSSASFRRKLDKKPTGFGVQGSCCLWLVKGKERTGVVCGWLMQTADCGLQH